LKRHKPSSTTYTDGHGGKKTGVMEDNKKEDLVTLFFKQNPQPPFPRGGTMGYSLFTLFIDTHLAQFSSFGWSD